jgi:hypothetical protein
LHLTSPTLFTQDWSIPLHGGRNVGMAINEAWRQRLQYLRAIVRPQSAFAGFGGLTLS